MTREEQILEYANSFKGKGMESEELKEIIRLAIIDGAKWADRHPVYPSLPSNLDEAARSICDELYLKEGKRDPYGNPYFLPDALMQAVFAGAEWTAGQGESHETEIVSRVTGNGLLPAVTCLVNKSYKEGDKVVIQIRKK